MPKKFVRKELVTVMLTSLLFSLSSYSVAGPEDDLKIDGFKNEGFTYDGEYRSISTASPGGIVVETWDHRWGTLVLGGGDGLKVHGKTSLDVTIKDAAGGVSTLVESSGGKKVELLGDVDLRTRHFGDNQEFLGGANGLYSVYKGEIVVGTKNTNTFVGSLAKKADAISAKAGSSVKINSTNNQIIGSIDFLAYSNVGMLDAALDIKAFVAKEEGNKLSQYLEEVAGKGSSVKITFSGKDSFWYGDEENVSNSVVKTSVVIPDWAAKKAGIDKEKLNEALKPYQGFTQFHKENGGHLELTFENGAEWTYFGITEPLEEGASYLGMSATATFFPIPKRISKITLQNGGAINLFDYGLGKRLDSIGLTKEIWPEVHGINHNYVRIGELNGSGGVFRLDLNSNKTDSDMIFIESSKEPGLHYIEPYNIENIKGISEKEHIRFATVAANSGVTFTDKINYYESELGQFQLYIGSEPYDPNDPENKYYEGRVYEDAYSEEAPQAFAATEEVSNEAESNPGENIGFNPKKDFEGGQNWFIYRVVRFDPAVVNFGLATWLYGTQLDRLNKRIGEIHYQENDSGLWVRGRFNRTGDSGIDLRWGGVQIGYDYKTSENNRVGAAFEYTNGRAKFDDYSGRDKMHGFNVMLYDTWVNEKGCYLDLTARWGKAHNKVRYDDLRQDRITGTYRQSIFALSAEAGKKIFLSEEKKLFIEPQIQFQWARVGSSSWTFSNNVNSKIDSANSYIGRVGARFGKEWTYEDGRRNNVYLKADLLHEFGKEQTGMVSDMKYSVNQKWGGKKTWGDVGVSTQMSLGKQTWFHLDLEKELGRGMGTSWQINGNIRYTF